MYMMHLLPKDHIRNHIPMKINEMIIAGRGTSFDPALVDEFVKIGDKIKECLASKEDYINNQRYFMYEG